MRMSREKIASDFKLGFGDWFSSEIDHDLFTIRQWESWSDKTEFSFIGDCDYELWHVLYDVFKISFTLKTIRKWNTVGDIIDSVYKQLNTPEGFRQHMDKLIKNFIKECKKEYPTTKFRVSESPENGNDYQYLIFHDSELFETSEDFETMKEDLLGEYRYDITFVLDYDMLRKRDKKIQKLNNSSKNDKIINIKEKIKNVK